MSYEDDYSVEYSEDNAYLYDDGRFEDISEDIQYGDLSNNFIVEHYGLDLPFYDDLDLEGRYYTYGSRSDYNEWRNEEIQKYRNKYIDEINSINEHNRKKRKKEILKKTKGIQTPNTKIKEELNSMEKKLQIFEMNGFEFELKEKNKELFFRIKNIKDTDNSLQVENFTYVSGKHGMLTDLYSEPTDLTEKLFSVFANSFLDSKILFYDDINFSNNDYIRIKISNMVTIQFCKSNSKWLCVETTDNRVNNTDIRNKIEIKELPKRFSNLKIQNCSIKVLSEYNMDIYFELLNEEEDKIDSMQFYCALYDQDNNIINVHNHIEVDLDDPFRIVTLYNVESTININELSKIMIYGK